MRQFGTTVPVGIVGLDPGDRMSQLDLVDAAGTCIDEGQVRMAILNRELELPENPKETE